LKKLALLGAVVALGTGVLFVTHKSHAADHLDAPTIKMVANRMADINDVYAWTTADASKVNLVMTVSPIDDDTHHFGPSVQYVFHVSSHPGATTHDAFTAPGTEERVICTFASETSIQCWVASGQTPIDYVTGDPSNTAGLTSHDGKMKVFAGRRSDPFFFNLAGFLTAQAIIEDDCSGGPPPAPRIACPGALGPPPGANIVDAAGCPHIPGGAAAIAAQLSASQSGAAHPSTLGPCPANQRDCFLNLNVRALVVQIDKSLLLSGSDRLLSVWASTHATP
jgi:hypothetical protein